MSINRVIISGNLTRDPELRATAAGTSVLSFGIAVNDRYFNKQTNQWEDRPNFVDCTLFGNRANGLAPYLTKGVKVALEGKLRFSQWQDKQGNNRSKLDVIVDEVELLSAQRTHQPAAQAPQQAYQPVQQAPVQQAPYQAQQAPGQAPQQPVAQPAQQPAQQQPAQQQPAMVYTPPQQAAQPVQQPAPQQQQMAGMPEPAPAPSIYDDDIPF